MLKMPFNCDFVFILIKHTFQSILLNETQINSTKFCKCTNNDLFDKILN